MKTTYEIKIRYEEGKPWFHHQTFDTEEEAFDYIFGQRHSFHNGEEVAIVRTTRQMIRVTKAEVKLTTRVL